MTTLALVFPGQGSQSVGMGRSLAEASPAAAAVFGEADAALGEPLSALAWDGPAETLDLTDERPAGAAGGVDRVPARARGAAGRDGLPALEPAFYAGHSMGQYSRDGRGRRDLARRRGAPRPRARPPDAGVGRGPPARWRP